MGWLWSEEYQAFYFMWPEWFMWFCVIGLFLFAVKLFVDNYPSLDGDKSAAVS